VTIAIQTRGLGRVYKSVQKGGADITALEDVSMDIEIGEVRGLLGPNGAGKTTLVKILSTVLLPTSGTASVLGNDVERETAAVRPLIGIVFGGDRGVYWHLTARQNLQYWAALYNVPAKETNQRISRLLERVGLGDRADHLVETYSRGMKQRLHLARGLVGDARILFLDEPTIGMDPLAARDFRNLVQELRSEGKTILLTTHDMAEAESVCDRVALIDHGRVIAVETPRTLSRLITQYERIDFECENAEVLDPLRAIPGVASVLPLPEERNFRIDLSEESASRIVLEKLITAGVTSIRTSRPSLEEVYVHIIGDRGLKLR
jgi:ABC-2 type transport system ATP-binding protein